MKLGNIADQLWKNLWKKLWENRPLLSRRSTHRNRWLALALVVGLLTGTLAACGPARTPSSGGRPDTSLVLVSFAVTRAAHAAIIPKFVAKWQQEQGQTVTFKYSYGGSGAQTRAVIDGLDADVVHLALALDVQKIEKAGLIQPGWDAKLPNHSIVSQSVAALVTRAGNPKAIKTWADLARSDVKWVTADPKTSGVARWNFLALWNAAAQQGGEQGGEQEAEPAALTAQQQVAKAYKNVLNLTRDAREASDVFLNQGQGDALITYENEVILAAQRGETATYSIPDVNISIENPVAVVDRNVDKHGNRAVAEAFVQYLYSPEAQAEFAKVGFRSAIPTASATYQAQFPTVKTLATVQDYGGWAAVQKKFFADGAIFDQLR
jgi:sulfate/thiosulfate transport system substrate-binding protein